MKKLLVAIFALAALAFAQGNTSLLSGTVTDPTGAAVPGAEVTVANIATGQIVKTTTNEKGEYSVPSLESGQYRVTVTKPGFKTGAKAGIEMASGVPATANIKLELGQATETVLVQGGAEIVQTTNAELSTTITGRQINELPFATRNAVELIVDVPGTQTPTNPRSSSINGLPKEAINITIDGMNTQDNWLKSSDGFFSYIMPSVDSLEEVTLSTSAGGVDSTNQGAAQIKFVTKSGTNALHGGGFYQVRNTALDANYYFNTINRLPRDIVKLNQYGGHIGGAIKKDKLFYFVNLELYRLPSTYNFSRTVLPPSGFNGDFTYKESNGTLNTLNLLSLAAGVNKTLPSSVRPFGTTVDPIVSKTLGQVWALVSGGNLTPNSGTNDFNRDTYAYQPNSNDQRDFFTTRIDYNVTVKHHLSFVLNYDKYDAIPDGLNSVVPVYAGTGTVLGSNVNAGQRSRRFAGTLTLRSALSPRLTNEFRFGLDGGTVLFEDAAGSDALYNEWRGFSPSFGYVSGVTTTTSPSRRNAPLKDLGETLSYVKGAHQLSFGFNWSSIRSWQQSTGTETIPGISFGVTSADPAVAGANAWFTTTSGLFPGITTSDLSSAESMYAMLTGRVSSISQQVTLGEANHQYGHDPAIDRNMQREFGFFAQDTWRVRSNLTLTLGLRLEDQRPFTNVDGLYSMPGYASVWGLSGVGNLFKPGTLSGTVPTFSQVAPGAAVYSEPPQILPSTGIAYQLPAKDGLLGILTGHHAGAAVLRAGYSISSLRPGGYVFQGIGANNKGLYYDTSVSNSTFPQYFGAAGSVYFTDPTLPGQPYPTAPAYPLPALVTDNVLDFNKTLHLGYTQSWNIGYQREIDRNTVVEFRYTGNHGLHEWRRVNINEVNVFENGFLQDATIARQNLAIANGVSIDQLPFLVSLKSTNWGNAGLPGQQNLKYINVAYGNTTDSTTATNLQSNAFGTVASNISSNVTRMANLVKGAGVPANFFVANPTVAGGGAYLMTDWGSSFYDAMQIEVRRRLSRGLSVQGSWVWAHSLTNGASASSSDAAQPTTLRNLGLDKGPTTFDIRQAYKLNWIYEFPFGAGRPLLSSVKNGIVRKAIEGWEMAGVLRFQSGTPSALGGSKATINGTSTGVVLHNISVSQLQSDLSINKYTNSSTGKGVLYDLPLNIVLNSEAAYNQTAVGPDGTKWTFDPSQPYISPQFAPGALGYTYFLRAPWQKHLDVSLVKKTRIKERAELEFRAQALNVMNITNFYLGSTNPNATTFGQITSAYRDTSGTVDPGGRILEFVVRVNF